MTATRRQLSLFVPRAAARPIEDVRAVVDPIQRALIPAHVTLCREDELGDLPAVLARLGGAAFGPLTLRFGPPERFHEHGLLLPCTAGQPRFRTLREHLLGSRELRPQPAHITLAHPRNPRAPGNSPEAAAAFPSELEITFPMVFLIEQRDSEPWRVLERHELNGTA